MASSHVLVPELSTDTYNQLSPNLWGRFPFASVGKVGGPFYFYEDWSKFPIPATNATTEAGMWNVFLSDGGAITDAAIADLSAISVTCDDDNEAVVLCQKNAGCRITADSGREVFFEARIRVSTISDTKNGFFCGLFEPLTPTATSHIGDDGAMVDKNFIGFHRLEGDGDKIDIVYKADTVTQVSFTDALTLVADTWYRVGFHFDGVRTLKFFFNGIEYTTARLTYSALSASAFPDDINLAPVIVGHKSASSSSEGSNLVNWLAHGYTRASSDLMP